MKWKKKGSIFNGYRRLFFREYGVHPYFEIQANWRCNGLGITWYIDSGYQSWTLELIFISLTLVI